MTILLAILALSFLVIVHEFGHFIVAKLGGIKVLEFALFMGPKLFSIQKGETLYSIRSIPLGGFVKMEGEEQESDDARAYNKKPVWIRAAVIAAGPLMNLIVAVIIIMVISGTVGYTTNVVEAVVDNSPADNAKIIGGDRIVSFDNKAVYHPADLGLFLYSSKGNTVDIEVLRNGKKETLSITPAKTPAMEDYKLGFSTRIVEGSYSNVVESVSSGGKAEAAGLKAGDRIVKINGQPITRMSEIQSYLRLNKLNPVKITVIRDGSTKELKEVIPNKLQIPERDYDIGVAFRGERGGGLELVKNSVIYSFSISRNVLYSLSWLATGRIGLNQMSGPIGIVSTIGDVVKTSTTVWETVLRLLSITSFISINLGLFNLIPFPALDGSKLLILGIEAVRRKAIPPEREAFISMIGLALLIMLMLFATYNDILRLTGK